MTDYQKNKKDEDERPDKPVIEQVVTSPVIQKKPPLGARIKNMLFGGEAHSAVSYVISDVFLPATRKLLVDAATNGIERLVYGEETPRRSRSRGRDDYRPRVSYATPPSRGRDPRMDARLPDQPPRAMPTRTTSESLILQSREEAELVAERLGDVIDNYEVASLADLNNLVGLPSEHVHNKWGWDNLNHYTINQVREGWLLDLPPVTQI